MDNRPSTGTPRHRLSDGSPKPPDYEGWDAEGGVPPQKGGYVCLYDRADLAEIRPGQTGKHARRVTIPDGADEVGLDPAAREELPIHRLVVEAGHRAAVEPNGPRGDDEIGPLQAAVAEGRHLSELGPVDEPGAGVGVGKEAGQPIVEPG